MTLNVTCAKCQSKLRIREEFAGKKVKCPKCMAVVQVAAAEEPVEAAIVEEPPKPRPPAKKPARADEPVDAAIVEERRRPAPAKARVVEEDDYDEDEDDRPKKKKGKWKPCPKCGAGGAQRVNYTFWGSFYFTPMFSHVRCPECGYGYNGKTGRSNIIPAILIPTITAMLIGAVIGFVVYIWVSRRS